MNKLILTIAAATFLSASAAKAQPGMLMKMADKLELTEQQIGQLQDLKIQHEKDLIQKQADLKLARLELKEIMIKVNIDEKAALSKQDRISGIKGEIAKAKLQHKLAARKVLDDKQLAKFKELSMKERPFGRSHKMGGCCGRGGPHMMGPGHGMGPGMGFGPGPGAPDTPERPDKD
jgi:hypothetical protein